MFVDVPRLLTGKGARGADRGRPVRAVGEDARGKAGRFEARFIRDTFGRLPTCERGDERGDETGGENLQR